MRACALAALCGCASGVTLGVALNASTASFAVTLDGAPWFTSAGYAIRSNRTWLSSNGTLTLASAVPTSGQGQFGFYTGYTATWDTPGAPGIWQTSVYVYPALNAAVFEQFFPVGLSGTWITAEADDDVCTAFPTFGPSRPQLDSQLAYLTFDGGHSPPRVGRWTAGGAHGATVEGGAVTAWYNASGAAVVLSPLTDVETQRGAFSSSLGDIFAVGFNGALSGIPAGWRAQSLLVAGNNVNDTFYSWGDLMLQVGGKARTALTADLATAYLSAWTDNGAYYYYNTEPNATYEKSMLDVLAYIKSADLPLRTLSFDSYWYYKRASDSALLLWEPLPSVFPDRMAPWPGIPLALHNRYFADVNNYTQMGFEFITESGSSLALPIDKNMFLYMMGRAKAWGMTLYEQDWHNRVWTGMRAPHTNITAAHSWLHAMGDAASELNLTIQYCLVEPATVLASAAIPAVTNIRASGDYHPGDYHDAVNHWNTWDIALTSLFFGALGVQPSKDVFWSTEIQPGNPYNASPSGDTEPNWFLHALAATLSTGPVSFGDGIGYTNASLIMRTCRAGDGLILKPDRPAHAVGAALAAVFNMSESASGTYILPNVTQTYSTHGPAAAGGGDPQAWRWHYVLAVSLQADFELPAADLGPAFNASERGYAVFDWFNMGAGPVGTIGGANGSAYTIPTGQALPSPPGGAHDVRYLLVAPLLPGGWVLLGETAKLVPMSTLRTTNFTAIADGPAGAGFTATVLTSPTGPGASLEGSVAYQVLPPGAAAPITVICPASGGTPATLSCFEAGGCACA